MKTAFEGGLVSNEPAQINPRSFSPNSRLIVIPIGNDAQVLEVETRKIVAKLSRHTGYVRAAEFSPDGRYVVTASADGTARVWSTQTWQSVAVLRGHKNEVLGASFGGVDGKSVLTSSNDGTSRLYPPEAYATLDDLKALAPHRITRQPRELTVDERKQYLSHLGLGDPAKRRLRLSKE